MSDEPPPALRDALRGEEPDFVVRATRGAPGREALPRAIAGAFLVAGTLLFLATLPAVGDWFARVGVVTLSVLFAAFAFPLLRTAWRGRRAAGAWVAGTPTRLVRAWPEGRVETHSWSAFAGAVAQPPDAAVVLLARPPLPPPASGLRVSPSSDWLFQRSVRLDGVDAWREVAAACEARIAHALPEAPTRSALPRIVQEALRDEPVLLVAHGQSPLAAIAVRLVRGAVLALVSLLGFVSPWLGVFPWQGAALAVLLFGVGGLAGVLVTATAPRPWGPRVVLTPTRVLHGAGAVREAPWGAFTGRLAASASPEGGLVDLETVTPRGRRCWVRVETSDPVGLARVAAACMLARSAK
ncbi:MAG: hypothetical protein QOE90_1154 [Thermoplasmata archaeon]|jgi:hypothetical protein|nr:hypothetical protein [Thermoplasmata archaeon]